MGRMTIGTLVAIAALSCTLAAGCGQEKKAKLKVERLPEVDPDLPDVPKLPPPPHPVTYDDGSYSVYGLRHEMSDTVHEVNWVKGYIVKIYEPPECAEEDDPDTRCEVLAPNMWMADEKGEEDKDKWLRVVDYAKNHEKLEEAKEKTDEGPTYNPNPDMPTAATGPSLVPVDFKVGNEVKVKGRFTYISAMGFKNSDGVLAYRKHETLEAVEDEEE